MTLDVVLLAVLVLFALMTVSAPRILWSVIGLAAVSAVLTILMFQFNAPIAGVFELSVCAGLIPAIFISAISLTRRLSPEAVAERKREKLRRFAILPIILIIAGVLLSQLHLVLNFAPPVPESGDANVRTVMWTVRHADLIGQLVVLLGGVFAVVVLIKEFRRDA